MKTLSQVRKLPRVWRVGLTVLAVIVIAFGGVVVVTRQHDSTSSVSDGYTTGGGSIAPAATAAPSFAASATTASRASSGAPASSGSAAVAPAPAVTANKPAGSASASSDSTVLNAPLPPSVIDQKVVRTGTIQLTVKDVTGTQNAIWNLATTLGGTVITSNTSGTDDNVRADISFRVPSERFKEAMDQVRGYAVKVEKEQSTAQDITEEYVDLQARQRNLEATSLQLQSLLTRATTVDETLKVQNQLNNVQSDLERIKGKLNYYDTRTAFSTISASILPAVPVKTPPVTPVAKWSFSHSIQEAWNRSVNGLQNVADALITVIIGGWWIELPLLLAIYFVARRGRRRAPAPVPVAASPLPGVEVREINES